MQMFAFYKQEDKNMTDSNNPYNPNAQKDGQEHKKTIQTSDIKTLIQQQGKANIDGKEFVLKNPSATDPKLQEIIKDPALSVKAVGDSSANGECEYDLSANGKSVKIKLECKSCK